MADKERLRELMQQKIGVTSMVAPAREQTYRLPLGSVTDKKEESAFWEVIADALPVYATPIHGGSTVGKESSAV